jgi:uncharacterized protein YecT (DUF1311 family)
MKSTKIIFFGLIAAAAFAQGVIAQGVVLPVDCAAATTQARMTECAYEDFQAATADYSARYKALADRLGARQQREQLRRTQKLWLD